MRAALEDFAAHLAASARGVGVGLVLVAWASVLGSQAHVSSEVLIYLEIGAAIVGIAIAQWFTSVPNQQRDKLEVNQARRRQPQQKDGGNRHERQPVQANGRDDQDRGGAMQPQTPERRVAGDQAE